MSERGTFTKQDEAAFWDDQVHRRLTFRHFFYSEINRVLWAQVFEELGPLDQQRVLFVGCGTTSSVAQRVAEVGGEITCADLSPDSIQKLMSHDFGPHRENIHGLVGDAEDLPLEDGCMDIVLAKAIIHHLDVDRFMREMRRIGAPGARLVCSEPLAGNPLINLFRRLTPSSRVPTEHPFTRRELRELCTHLEDGSIRRRFNFFLALGSLPWFFLRLRKIGQVMFHLGVAMDKALFAICPPLRMLAWNVTVSGRLRDAERGGSDGGAA